MKLTTPMLLGGLAGAVLGDIIPTPGDAVSFYLFKKNRDAWAKGELTSKQYWTRESLSYYLPNAIWWSVVALIAWNAGKNIETKLKLLTFIVGGGVVVSIIGKSIYDDEKQQLSEKNAKAHELLKNNNEKI